MSRAHVLVIDSEVASEVARERSLLERALGFFSTLVLEPLADHIIQALCLETGARRGVIWIAENEGDKRLTLASATSLELLEEERETVELSELEEQQGSLREESRCSFVVRENDPLDPGGETPALYLVLRHVERPVGLVRLSDKLDGGDFSESDCFRSERLGTHAGLALSHALRLAALEQRSFRHPSTKAYTRGFFEDVARSELQKARRSKRRLSLAALEIDSLDLLRRSFEGGSFDAWLESVVCTASDVLRATDLIAAESESRYNLLLPETDALGAAVLKRRLRDAVAACPAFAQLEAVEQPPVLLATVTYPEDGNQLDALSAALEERLTCDRESLIRSLGLEMEPFPGVLNALLERGEVHSLEKLNDWILDLFASITRWSQQPGLCFLAPQSVFKGAVQSGLARLGTAPESEIVLFSDEEIQVPAGLAPSRFPARAAGTELAFAVWFCSNSAFALLVGPRVDAASSISCYHTDDRCLVEHLAFQLQRDLDIGVSRPASADNRLLKPA